MFKLPFFRANLSKKIPKKNTREWKEFQEKLQKRKNADNITDQISENLEARIPRLFR